MAENSDSRVVLKYNAPLMSYLTDEFTFHGGWVTRYDKILKACGYILNLLWQFNDASSFPNFQSCKLPNI